MKLKFNIKNQKIIRTDGEYTVNLSQDYLECDFTFTTDDWEDLTRYVTFTVKGKSYRYELDEHDNVRVPNDILKYKYFYIKLHGVSKENRTLITTNELIILLKITGYKDNLQPSSEEHSGDVITLLKEKINAKVDHFELTDNNLICYSGETVIQIIPFKFLENYYTKSETDNLLKKTIVNVDSTELADTGFLIFEKYEI